ncbi:hypothetical protein SJAV_20350 [Sulfurisphaera javensis]|uniref:Uncharacterized protein n=1 Tax=Sulfurisphaera javensis TaxID=2049879 RepID=A0AAT9GT17_9CREN
MKRKMNSISCEKTTFIKKVVTTLLLIVIIALPLSILSIQTHADVTITRVQNL